MTNKSVYRPKWLDDPARDRRTATNTDSYVNNLKKVVREAAAEIWMKEGGKSILYLSLRDAYSGIDILNSEK